MASETEIDLCYNQLEELVDSEVEIIESSNHTYDILASTNKLNIERDKFLTLIKAIQCSDPKLYEFELDRLRGLTQMYASAKQKFISSQSQTKISPKPDGESSLGEINGITTPCQDQDSSIATDSTQNKIFLRG